jgi:hypothetical protein
MIQVADALDSRGEIKLVRKKGKGEGVATRPVLAVLQNFIATEAFSTWEQPEKPYPFYLEAVKTTA